MAWDDAEIRSFGTCRVDEFGGGNANGIPAFDIAFELESEPEACCWWWRDDLDIPEADPAVALPKIKNTETEKYWKRLKSNLLGSSRTLFKIFFKRKYYFIILPV